MAGQQGMSGTPALLQGSFSAGEIAPSLYARTDLAKFHSGLALCRNFFIQATGGALNRAGTLFCGSIPNVTTARLIPFSYNAQNTYAIVLVDSLFYFVTDGGFVEVGGAQYTVAHPYAAADLFNITFTQSNDVLTLTHPNYPPAQLLRYGNANWVYQPINPGVTITAPHMSFLSGTNQGFPDGDNNIKTLTTPFTYALTSCTLNPPQESTLGNSLACINYDLSFNNYGVFNDVYWIPPADQKTDYYNVYRYYLGTWGFCGSTVGQLDTTGLGSVGGTLAVHWQDKGVIPDTNTTPPMQINPFWSSEFMASSLGTVCSVTSLTSGTISVGDVLSAYQLDAGTTVAGWLTGGSFLASCNGTRMTVSQFNAGTLAVGDTLSGPSITGSCSVLSIGSNGTGGGVGTFGMSAANSAAASGMLALSAGAATFAVSASQTVMAGTLTTSSGTFVGSITGTVLSATRLLAGNLTTGQVVTGTGVSSGTTMTSCLTGASFNGAMSGNLLTVESTLCGTVSVGNSVVGPLVLNPTSITSAGTGSTGGGDGVYTISSAQTFGVQGVLGLTSGNATFVLSNDRSVGSRLFVGGVQYPAACAYFQQRAVFGGSNVSPNQFVTSRTGNYNNFNISNPLRADDAITVNLVSAQANQVRHFCSLTDLLAFTSDGCWKISGQSNSGDVITPSNVVAVPQAVAGCSHVRPLVIAPQILYVQEKGNSVRELLYDVFRTMYTGTDRSVLASHLFFGYNIVDWAWAREPYKIVWAVRDDGKLLGLTYMPEQEVYAWHQHDTISTGSVSSYGGGGVTEGFLSTCAVTEGQQDAVYFAVLRFLNGANTLCIERMQSRILGQGNNQISAAWFVDCGVQYQGTPTRTFQAPHLAGQTVAILADGAVKTQQVLDGYGNGVLDVPASQITVGLPITAQLQTLPVDAGEPTIQGKKKRVTQVMLFVENTRGLQAGPVTSNGPELELVKPRFAEAWGNPPALQTGQLGPVHIQGNWDGYGDLFVQQANPLPAAVLGIEPWVAIGE